MVVHQRARHQEPRPATRRKDGNMEDRWTDRDDLNAAFYGIVEPQVNLVASNKISGLMKISATGGPRPDAQLPRLVGVLWR